MISEWRGSLTHNRRFRNSRCQNIFPDWFFVVCIHLQYSRVGHGIFQSRGPRYFLQQLVFFRGLQIYQFFCFRSYVPQIEDKTLKKEEVVLDTSIVAHEHSLTKTLQTKAVRWGGVGGGGVVYSVCECRMTIDPRIPAMPGRSTSGFHQPRRHCLHGGRGGEVLVHANAPSSHYRSVFFSSEMNGFWMTGLLNPKSSGKKKIIGHFSSVLDDPRVVYLGHGSFHHPGVHDGSFYFFPPKNSFWERS